MKEPIRKWDLISNGRDTAYFVLEENFEGDNYIVYPLEKINDNLCKLSLNKSNFSFKTNEETEMPGEIMLEILTKEKSDEFYKITDLNLLDYFQKHFELFYKS